MINKLNFTTLIFSALAALSLASCDDSDSGYKPLTKEEKAECFNHTRGVYKGKLVYVTDSVKNGRNANDTIDVQWSVTTDSTLVIEKMPSRLYATWVTNAGLKKALQEAPAQDLTCRTNYFQTSPVGCWVNPVAPTFNLTYGGKEHKVQIVFYTNYSNSYAFYKPSTKQMQVQVVQGAIFVDSKQSTDVKSGAAFLLYGTKQSMLMNEQ